MKCRICGELLLYAQRPVGTRSLFSDMHISCGMEEIRKACIRDSQTDTKSFNKARTEGV